MFFVLTCLFCYLVGSKDRSLVRLQVSHLCDPGSNPSVDAVRGLSLLFVLFFDPREAFLLVLRFSPVLVTNIFKFQFDLGRFVHG